jgi:DNA-binding transcriptional LysR family regulator
MTNSRHHFNIPIEIIRSVIAIAEMGSFSKAAHHLGLTQPAVSSQIKRIQTLVGGAIFNLTPYGATPTELGKHILNQARRILEANDQILRLGGTSDSPHTLRLGISTLFAREFFRDQSAETLTHVVVHTDNSIGIAKGLVDGYLDIGCLLAPRDGVAEIEHLIVRQWDEQFVWVRSPRFVLNPGKPIPIITWPGDALTINALTQQKLPYRIAFNSPDYHAKFLAVEAGTGLTAIPARMIPPYLIEAQESYLPALPPCRAYLCARPDIELGQAKDCFTSMLNAFAKN